MNGPGGAEEWGELLFEHGSTLALRLDAGAKIQAVSRALADRLGMERSAPVGAPLERLLHPAHLPFPEAVQELLRGERPVELALGSDGPPFWAVWRGRRMAEGVLLIADATEGRVAHRPPEGMERLAADFPGVFWKTDADLRVTAAVGGGTTLRNHPVQAMLGADLAAFFEDPTLPPVVAHRGALAGRTEEYEIEREGRFFRARVEPQYDTSGEVVGVVGVALEVAPPRLVESRLRPAQREQTLGRLAGSMAHEFNNLLTVISAHSELLEEQLETRSALEDISAIKQAASQGCGMTARLLSFTRRQIQQPENIRVSLLLRELEPVLRTFAGTRRKVVFEVEPNLGWVKLDPALFEQVMLSLVDNAVRATQPEGAIVVAASLGETGWVRLEVSDDGCGMSAADRRRACEPFFTTRPQGQGGGLGLTTALAVVREVGGDLSIESTPGRGTRVRIAFPRAEAPSGSYTLDPAPIVEETVLLVEDQLGVRRAARRILRRAGYRVFEAAHGADALALLEAYEGPLDLLLTDVVMPGMSGPQLAERLLEVRPDLEVLYMSGYAEDVHEVRRALSRGQHFLAKPFTPEQLLRKVRVAVDGEDESFATAADG